MSNRAKLRHGQRAAQDQALAAARDAAAQYGSVVTCYRVDPGYACLFADAADSTCIGQARTAVRLQLHGDTRLPLVRYACDGHALLVVHLVAQALRDEGVVDSFALRVDPRLDGTAVP